MRVAVNGKTFSLLQKGGVARVATEIVRAIGRERPDITLDVLVPCPPAGAALPDMPDSVGYVTKTSRAYTSGYGRSAWEQLLLPRIVRAGGYDILLNLSNSAPVWLSPGIPQLLLVHDSGFLNHELFHLRRQIDLHQRHLDPVDPRHLRCGGRKLQLPLQRSSCGQIHRPP